MTTPTTEETIAIQKINELKDHEEELQSIQRKFEDEWGIWAPANMHEMYELVEKGGSQIYVLRLYQDGILGSPAGLLRARFANVGGDYRRILQKFPTFSTAISYEKYEEGDTALLADITIFKEAGRGRGYGSVFRDAVLQKLPQFVKYAMPITPVPASFIQKLKALNGNYGALDVKDMPPAMRFHVRGTAELVGYQEDYRMPDPSRLNFGRGRQHDRDVAFSRYSRLSSGLWNKG